MTGKMNKAISPEQCTAGKQEIIPDVVFDAFNELIVRNLRENAARVYQDDIVSLIVSKGIPRQEIFDKNFLDIEDVYREAGWGVVYDKPGYNESYKASFAFTKGKQ